MGGCGYEARPLRPEDERGRCGREPTHVVTVAMRFPALDRVDNSYSVLGPQVRIYRGATCAAHVLSAKAWCDYHRPMVELVGDIARAHEEWAALV